MSKPDWDFWLHMPKVKVWQACALSLRIDPDWLKRTPYGMSGSGAGPIFSSTSFPSPSVKQEYEKRVRLTAANLGEGDHFRIDDFVGEPSLDSIYLADFARWAINVVHWKDLPGELAALARPSSPLDTSARRPDSDTSPNSIGARPIVVKLKGNRSNILDGVIQAARNAATDDTDYQQVWAALVRLASSQNPPAPILEHIEGDGVKYQDESGIKFFTKDALRKRMKRAGD